MAWTVSWSVTIAGVDLTSAMQPYLIDIEVTDKDGTSGDASTLTLDDTAGQIHMPQKRDAVEIRLDGVTVFKGVVDQVTSSGARGGGRLLKVSAKSFDTRGKAKEGQSFHRDDATLKDFLGQAATNAGFDLIIDDELGAIQRDYWAADGESFLALGERLARELYGTFKLRGTQAVLVPRGSTSITGVTATVGSGGNVINWEISPFKGRGKYKRARVHHFNRAAAKFETTDTDIVLTDGDDSAPDTTNVVRGTAADADHAKVIGKGRAAEAAREAGSGTIEMDLTPEAQAESMLTLTGTRPGIDGTWRIVTVTHKANRKGGATTKLDVKQPGGGVGKDSRKSKRAAATPTYDDPDIVPASPSKSK